MTVLVHDGAPQPRRSVHAHVWAHALLGWLAMAAAMTLNGIAREIALVPTLGATAAGVASAISGITLLQIIAWQTFRNRLASSFLLLAAIAAVWVLMTIGFELGLGHFIDHKSWADLFANYNLLDGHLWPLVLASVGAAPFLWGRER